MYATARSGPMGHAPTSVWYSRYSTPGSDGVPAGQWSALRSPHRRAAFAHRSGTSASTSSRARTSSDRFVSCVESAFRVHGLSAARRRHRSWNPEGESPQRAGSIPTSFSATNRLYR